MKKLNNHLVWFFVFITIVGISTYIVGPSWVLSNHGFKHVEKRVLMNFFLSASHSQIPKKQRVTNGCFSPILAEIGADGNWCDSNYLAPEDLNAYESDNETEQEAITGKWASRVFGVLYLIIIWLVLGPVFKQAFNFRK